MQGMLYDFSRYRVHIAKDEHGLGLGIEKFVTTVDSLYEAVVAETGHRVIRFASIFVPKPADKELLYIEGLIHCLRYIDSKEPPGERLMINIPKDSMHDKIIKFFRGLFPHRDITFRATDHRYIYTERELALDALRRRSTIEEVLLRFNELK